MTNTIQIMEKLNINDYTFNDMSVSETAFQLTAYERYGCINFEEYLKDILKAQINEKFLSDYNEFCTETEQYDSSIYHINEFDDVFVGVKPYDIAKMVYRGTFTTGKAYFTYNGDGNIKSLEEYEVIREIRNEAEFLEWYIENNIANDNFYETFKNDCLKVAMALVKAGY